MTIHFDVYDSKTGKLADICEIALNEEWAEGLIYCDMEGWILDQDGVLSLHDECGGIAYPPDPERFVVEVIDGPRPRGEPMTPEQIQEWIAKAMSGVDKTQE